MTALTDAERRTIRELRAQNLSYKAIGRRLRHTHQRISVEARAMGLPPLPMMCHGAPLRPERWRGWETRCDRRYRERLAPIMALLLAGHSWASAARELGITKNKIAGLLYRAGLCTSKARTPLAPRMSEIVAQIDFRGCNHIRGNPRDIRPGMYCGKPVARHGLCADHAALCWITPPAPAARPAPVAQ